jgi:uncharacterized protein
MRLDLREIIGVPGGRVTFEFEPDLSDAAFGSVVAIESAPRAAGNVTNSAGVLTFSAIADATCVCVCARCLKGFKLPVHQQITALLMEEGDGENPDGYAIAGDWIDAGEIVRTEFLLAMEDRLLCSDDCAGLCGRCGADLNDGPCDCKPEIDPRLAVLAQFEVTN